jgi:hypothetical protein
MGEQRDKLLDDHARQTEQENRLPTPEDYHAYAVMVCIGMVLPTDNESEAMRQAGYILGDALENTGSVQDVSVYVAFGQ